MLVSIHEEQDRVEMRIGKEALDGILGFLLPMCGGLVGSVSVDLLEWCFS